MARPIRNTEPGRIHLLSCRTRSSELLLIPSPEMNNLIGGILSKYSQLYSIDIYAVCVLSNHYHLVLSTSIEGNIALFAENINREICKRVNKLLNREGSLWSRRYDDLLVLENKDAFEAIIYTITNPTKHGLVANSSSWPGISSYNANCNKEKPKTYTFFNYTRYYKARRRALLTGEVIKRHEYEKEYTLKIKNLKNYSNEKILKESKKRIRKFQEDRWSSNKKFLGRKSVLNQAKKGVFPKETNQSKRPACYTRCKRALSEFIEELKLTREKYFLASMRYRAGLEDFDFPFFCYYPPRHHIPKYVPI